MNSAHARRLLLAAALLGFVLRAAFGLIYWQGRPLTHDEREYLALAANVAAGRGFAQDLPNEPHEGDADVQRFGRAPMYPLFLAPIVAFDAALRDGRMPDDVPDAVKVAQSLVGAIGVWLLGAIARRVGGDTDGRDRRVHRRRLSTARLDLRLRAQRSVVRDARARVRLVADAGAGSADRRPDGPREPGGGGGWGGWGGSSSAALLIGLRCTHAPRDAVLLPFALLLGWRRRAAFAARMLAGTLAVVLPWTARNAAVYGRFVLVASEGGVTFWTGNHREARGEGDLAANPHLKQLNREFRERASRTDRRRAGTDLLS